MDDPVAVIHRIEQLAGELDDICDQLAVSDPAAADDARTSLAQATRKVIVLAAARLPPIGVTITLTDELDGFG